MKPLLSYILLVSILLAISCKGDKKNNLTSTNKTEILFKSILDTIKIKPLNITTLTQSMWIFTPFENCSSSYLFKEEGNGEGFNCEMDLKYDIKYKIINDTLFIEEFDMPTEDNPEHKTFKTRDDKYVFNGRSLILIGSKLYNMAGITFTPQIEIVIEYKKQ